MGANIVTIGTMVAEVTMDTERTMVANMDTVGTMVAHMVTVGTTEVSMVTSRTSKDKTLSALSL